MLSRGRQFRGQRGYSFIELVVTVMIFAVLASIAVPSMLRMIRLQELKNAANDIQMGMEKARVEALKRNRSVGFWLVSLDDNSVMDDSCEISASGRSWVVALESPEGKCGTTPSESTSPYIIEAHPAGDGHPNVAVSSLDSGGGSSNGEIVFNGLGRIVTDSDGISTVNVTVVDAPTGRDKLRVDVSGSGSIHVCDPYITDSSDSRSC